MTLTDPFGLVDIYLLPFTKPSYVRHLFPEGKAVSYDEAVERYWNERSWTLPGGMCSCPISSMCPGVSGPWSARRSRDI